MPCDTHKQQGGGATLPESGVVRPAGGGVGSDAPYLFLHSELSGWLWASPKRLLRVREDLRCFRRVGSLCVEPRETALRRDCGIAAVLLVPLKHFNT